MADDKKPLTDAEYKALLRALHPDSATEALRNEAFALVVAKKDALAEPSQQRLERETAVRTQEDMAWRAARRAARLRRSATAKAAWERKKAAKAED